MKIALIAPSHLPSRRANSVQVTKMAQALTRLGHETTLIVPAPPGAAANVPWDELAHHYGLAHPFPVVWLPAHPRARGYDFGWRAVRWSRRWPADLVYTRLPQAAALSSALGLPTLYEIHDLPQGKLGPWLFRRIARAPATRGIIAITRALARDLESIIASPIPNTHPSTTSGLRPPSAQDATPNTQYPIPNTLIAPDGVDLARYENLPNPAAARSLLPTPYALRPASFTAGYTGHLYPGRGAELLIQLAARLPDIHFLIVGGNPEDLARLQSKIEERRTKNENLTLTGFVPNAELPLYQAACDVLLMPYQRRVAASSGGDIARYLSPMKLFEYLACGRAIVSSDLPVLREVLTPENAVLLPPDDVDAWVNALRELRANPEKRAALAAQARLEAQKYAWEKRAEQILERLSLG